MEFETWWKALWEQGDGHPAVASLSFEELARKAWDAGCAEGYSEGYVDGQEAAFDRMQ